MTIDPITVDSAIVCNARTIINFIDEIKNTEITDITLHKLRTLFQILIDYYNSKPFNRLPISITEERVDKIGFEIRSSYQPSLKFSEIPRLIIDSLRLAESHMDESRCLDAICVLRDYCNIVVYSRFDHGLELEPKIGEWNSPNRISTQLVDGDKSCII